VKSDDRGGSEAMGHDEVAIQSAGGGEAERVGEVWREGGSVNGEGKERLQLILMTDGREGKEKKTDLKESMSASN